MTNNRIAIVIGSGGVKCAAALGLWKTLQEAGIDACMAVGASGGSLYAAVIALGFDVEHALQLTLDLWRSDLMEGYTNNLRAAMSSEALFTEHSRLINDERLWTVCITPSASIVLPRHASLYTSFLPTYSVVRE